jgi:hypothetical protein
MATPDLFDVPVPADAPTPAFDAMLTERGDPRGPGPTHLCSVCKKVQPLLGGHTCKTSARPAKSPAARKPTIVHPSP